MKDQGINDFISICDVVKKRGRKGGRQPYSNKLSISQTCRRINDPVSYTHLRAHETGRNLVCRLLLEKKKKERNKKKKQIKQKKIKKKQMKIIQ